MPDCAHDTFESLVTVQRVEVPNAAPYYQARLQVRCTSCQGLLTFGGLPPVHPSMFYTVAVGAGGSEVYLSGVVTPPSLPQAEQAWTRVVKADGLERETSAPGEAPQA